MQPQPLPIPIHPTHILDSAAPLTAGAVSDARRCICCGAKLRIQERLRRRTKRITINIQQDAALRTPCRKT